MKSIEASPGRLLRNLLSLSAAEVATRLIGFTTFAVLARRLEPSAYGAVEFAVALALFFAMAVDFGLGTIGARAIARDRDEVGRLAAQIPTARLLMAVVAIPAMGGLAIAAGQPRETVQLVWLFSMGLLAVPWFQRWLFQGLEMMNWVSIGQIVRATAFCVGVVFLVREAEDLAAVGIVEILAALLVTVFYLSAQQLRVAPVRLNFSPSAISQLLRESAPVGLGQMVWASNQYTPIILVAALADGEAVSFFGAAQRIVLAVVSFSWVYHFNLFPSVSKRLKESGPAFDSLVRTSFNAITWLGVMVSMAGALFADLICRTVFGEAFGAASTPLMILVWVIPVTILSGHARVTLIAGGEQRFVLAAQLAGAGVTLLVGLATIPFYGAMAGAATMLASNLAVWAVAHFFAVRRVAPLPLLGVVRPMVVAGIAYGLREVYAPSSLLAGAMALAGYVIFGPLLDRSFVANIRRLMELTREVP